MTYQLNINDPRTLRRVRKSLGFVCSILSPTGSSPWSSRYIDKFLGKSTNPLSRHLRTILLINTDSFYRFNSNQGSKCKEYRLNELGVQYLSEILEGGVTVDWYTYKRDVSVVDKETSLYNILYTKLPSVLQVKTQLINEWADQEFGEQLTTGLFIYRIQSNRKWHDLVRMPKEIKKPIYSRYGYKYNYDIEASAPTLIHQLARQVGMTKKTPYLDEFLSDRAYHRIALAEHLNISLKQAKTIITSLFSGAKMGMGNSIARQLDNDRTKMQLLQSNVFIRHLRGDIKKCWDQIKLAKNIDKRLQPRDKWNIYFELELSVMNQIEKYLRKNNNLHISEHDGWVSQQVIDDVELRTLVRTKTGYDVRFSLEVLGE